MIPPKDAFSTKDQANNSFCSIIVLQIKPSYFFFLLKTPRSRSESNQHGCLKESLSQTLQHPPARRYRAVSHCTEGTQRGMKAVLVPVNSS